MSWHSAGCRSRVAGVGRSASEVRPSLCRVQGQPEFLPLVAVFPSELGALTGTL